MNSDRVKCSPSLWQDLLVPVFENGRLLQDYDLEEIRQRAELPQVILSN